jgi:hypothetical protein
MKTLRIKLLKRAILKTLLEWVRCFIKKKGAIKRLSGAAAKITPISKGLYPEVCKILGIKII